MAIIETLGLTVLFVFIAWFGIVSSYAAMKERDAIKKQYKAGTHDYYGNKLEKKIKE